MANPVVEHSDSQPRESSCPWDTLPNEIFHNILTCLSTKSLVPLSRTSRRFYTLVARIIHFRLLTAARLENHTLLFECYHPTAKLTEPQMFCLYQGTIGLDVNLKLEGEQSSAPYIADLAESGYPPHSFANFHKLYSSFRPQLPDPDRSMHASRRRHPAGDIPGSRTYDRTPSSDGSSSGDESESGSSSVDTQFVSHTISLDFHELFTQLCTTTNLVIDGPREGLFLSFIAVSDGVVRVWRDWLRTMSSGAFNSGIQILNERKRRDSSNKGKSKEDPEIRFTSVCDALQGDKRILWVDDAMTVGIRVSVQERHLRRQQELPILMEASEVPVNYDIVFEEVLIRTSHLLLSVEKADLSLEEHGKNVIIFGAYR